MSNKIELNNAVNAAGPGTTITLTEGTWDDTFIEVEKSGTATNPITITAQTKLPDRFL